MIVLQTVLEEVKHRNLSIYKRLKTMVQTGGRNVFVFANEHHADTYRFPRPLFRACGVCGCMCVCVCVCVVCVCVCVCAGFRVLGCRV